MTFPFLDPRRQRGQATPPTTTSGLLSQAEIERAERFKRVYEVQGAFEFSCLAEAEVMLNRLEFVRWRKRREVESRR